MVVDHDRGCIQLLTDIHELIEIVTEYGGLKCRGQIVGLGDRGCNIVVWVYAYHWAEYLKSA